MSAIIFDLFETLVTEWGRPNCPDYKVMQIASDLGVNYDDFKRELNTINYERYMGKFSGSMALLNQILSKLEVDVSEKILQMVADKRDSSKKACFDKIEQPIIDMLVSLREKGYKLGLISNCSSEDVAGFTNSALAELFDMVVFSCDIKMVKPERAIYDYCLSQLSEQSANSFFVGDGGSNELFGAERAGMTALKALWFTKRLKNTDELDKSFQSFYEPEELTKFFALRTETQ